jgi:cbb3-type cytochrome oxidase subunit 3
VLAILLFGSVVLLSAFGVQSLTAYLSVFSLCYFADSFVFRPKRRSLDFVGLGLLYYTLLFLAVTFRV